ncbi:MAG: TonB-dependent receptor, partial [Acidobacteria bacterium]
MEKQVEDRQRRKGWIRFLKAIAGIVAVSFVLARTQVMAQSTAQISGVVTDQSGAILPGVEVKVTQTDTGITRSAVTNETGLYILPNLPIGPYRLEAALPGFRSYVQTGIVLQVGSNPVLNMLMEVGQVSETVEVQADAALVETRNTG